MNRLELHKKNIVSRINHLKECARMSAVYSASASLCPGSVLSEEEMFGNPAFEKYLLPELQKRVGQISSLERKLARINSELSKLTEKENGRPE